MVFQTRAHGRLLRFTVMVVALAYLFAFGSGAFAPYASGTTYARCFLDFRGCSSTRVLLTCWLRFRWIPFLTHIQYSTALRFTLIVAALDPSFLVFLRVLDVEGLLRG